MVQISVLSNEQQRKLNISPSLDGLDLRSSLLPLGRVDASITLPSLNRRLHFPALVSAEAHVVVEDVTVASIQFPQQRTSWAFACALVIVLALYRSPGCNW